MFTLHPQAERALNMLRQNGFEAYLVGGCVRDFLLGVEPKDYDLTTSARPEEVKIVFSGFRTLDTGIRHGTVTVMMEQIPLEITTYRVEGGYSDARHPDSVRFTDSLRQDVSRRDFTMNAVAYAPWEGIMDYFGGAEDIDKRLIRCVGDPNRRFQEDALRILRAVRFASVLGFSLEQETAKAALQNQKLLDRVSAERIAGELTKLLCGRNAGKVFEQFYPILRAVLPELPAAGPSPETVEALRRVEPVPARRWAVLFWRVGTSSASAALERLKVSRELREETVTLLGFCGEPVPVDRIGVRQLISRLGETMFFDLLAVHRAAFSAGNGLKEGETVHFDEIETIAREILCSGACLTVGQLDIRGTDLIRRGFRGREIGRMLTVLLEAVLAEKTENQKENLLIYAEKYRLSSEFFTENPERGETFTS